MLVWALCFQRHREPAAVVYVLVGFLFSVLLLFPLSVGLRAWLAMFFPSFLFGLFAMQDEKPNLTIFESDVSYECNLHATAHPLSSVALNHCKLKQHRRYL